MVTKLKVFSYFVWSIVLPTYQQQFYQFTSLYLLIYLFLQWKDKIVAKCFAHKQLAI